MLAVDAPSLYFRAFHGIPEKAARTAAGEPVNAVRGFLDFISRLVADYRPTHLVCAWDNDWRPQWRVDLIPSYKAHRVVAERPGDTPDIEEVPDPEDRRMKHIQLSDKGRETMSQRSESRIARSQQVLQGMTAESQQELIRSLEALVSVHCEREATNQ